MDDQFEQGRFRIPQPSIDPVTRLRSRVALALGLVAFATLVAWLARSGYVDASGGEPNLLDALYYSTVSITTTGYGDIVPVTDAARLITALVITPARVLFLIVVVGTTLEILAGRSRTAYRVRRWREHLSEHVIICGYGVKGKAAIEALLGQGVKRSEIVVIDPVDSAIEEANSAGYAGLVGNASRVVVLEEAGIERASAVIVASDKDEAAALILLTARELSKAATIVVAVRESENVRLMERGGADLVVTSSSAAGRLLGLASQTPDLVRVLDDLMSVGKGLDIVERAVEEHEVGPLADLATREPIVAVVRRKEGKRLERDILRFDDERAEMLRPGDEVVCLRSNVPADGDS